MNLQKKMLYFAVCLTSLGVLGVVPYANMWAENRSAMASPQQVISSNILPNVPTLVTGKPVSLSIPSLGIDLMVADGAYDSQTGEWTLSKDMAHYALPTVQPNNEEGNTLIYGHNRREVFANLAQLTPHARVVLTTDNGYQFTYNYTSSEKVDPTNVEIFTYKGEPRLTLQTCAGAWYQDREFFYFKYESYQKL